MEFKLVLIDDFECFLWCWEDVTIVVVIEVYNGLLVGLLNLEPFWIKPFLFEFALIYFFGILGAAFPHPANHLHEIRIS
jgi:hypothetical protein